MNIIPGPIISLNQILKRCCLPDQTGCLVHIVTDCIGLYNSQRVSVPLPWQPFSWKAFGTNVIDKYREKIVLEDILFSLGLIKTKCGSSRKLINGCECFQAAEKIDSKLV